MSYLRITNITGPEYPVPVELADLGYTVAFDATNFVISNQFSPEDLQNSADLIAAVRASLLKAQVNLDGAWVDVAALDFDGEDVYAAFANIYEIVNTIDNQRLVDGSDCSDTTDDQLELHNHDQRYYTKGQLNSTTDGSSGASLIGTFDGDWTSITGDTVQAALDSIDATIQGYDLDDAYDNDADGILHVDGATKPLDLRSDGVNDISISRKVLTAYQQALLLDVSGNMLYLGAGADGALAAIDVTIPTNLTVNGNITFSGTITDTTVNEVNVTNASIMLRDGAINGADAYIYVERGATGADADLMWDESAERWKAGEVGTEETIALLERDEVVTGVWEFQGGAATEPNMYFTNKAAAPTTNLGAAGQYPVSLINGQLAVYDKSNSRNKFLSVARFKAEFSGRDHDKNKNEYLRTNGAFTSNKTGYRLNQAVTLVSITLESGGAVAWSAKVRKNYNELVDIAVKATGGARGVQDNTLNVDLGAGDTIQVFMDSAGLEIDRPNVILEYAYKY